MRAHVDDPRRSIPSIERLLASDAFADLLASAPRARVVAAVQAVQEAVRARGESAMAASRDAAWYADATATELAQQSLPSLRPVINATGVVLHTNLGRAPLATEATGSMLRVAAGYSNLEYDVETGQRGSRYVHCERLLRELTGADAALVVNNNAAALVLALNTIAADRDVVVSRGELVEIGGGFRVPEIVQRSGARLREVGATNRTRPADYVRALDARVAALLKVHRSNFHMHGFFEEASLDDLADVARSADVPLMHDLGSGLLLEPVPPLLAGEPTPQRSLAAGADIVAFSGDKLLGGPQAGILVGRADWIEAMRRNPLCRAFRVDRLTLAALEATLALYRDDRAVERVPVLRMIHAPAADLGARAHAIAARLAAAGVHTEVVASDGVVGGGCLPDVRLPGFAVRIEPGMSAGRAEAMLRAGSLPVIALVRDDAVLLDVRTVAPAEDVELIAAVSALR